MDIFIVIISTFFIMQLLYSLFTTGMMTDLWHLASVTLPKIDMGNYSNFQAEADVRKRVNSVITYVFNKQVLLSCF